MLADAPHLLLIESDDEVLHVAPPFMERVGVVHVARTLVEAIEVIAEVRVSVLLVANRLLAEQGTEVLESLRHQQPLAQVLVLCEQQTTEVSASLLAKGIGDVLVKPFDVATLPHRITRLLEVMEEQQRRLQLQRELEARMQHHDRIALLGTLVATVAHDIANPLAVVMTNAELMSEMLGCESSADGEERAVMCEATSETLQATKIIKDYLLRLLHFSRKEPHNLGDRDLAETLRMALLFTRDRARHRGVHVHVAPLTQLPTVNHRTSAFAQAVVNALTNAIDAAGPKGNVWLSVKESESDVTVIVRDDGPGLLGEQQKRFREAFYTTKETGTGLGTVVIRQVMNEHGGSVEWKAEPGEGMEVLLSLPLD